MTDWTMAGEISEGRVPKLLKSPFYDTIAKWFPHWIYLFFSTLRCRKSLKCEYSCELKSLWEFLSRQHYDRNQSSFEKPSCARFLSPVDAFLIPVKLQSWWFFSPAKGYVSGEQCYLVWELFYFHLENFPLSTEIPKNPVVILSELY